MSKPPSKIMGGEMPVVRDVSAPKTLAPAETIGVGESVTVETREIDNGYVTRKTGWDQNTGEWKESEEFSETPPKVTVTVDGD